MILLLKSNNDLWIDRFAAYLSKNDISYLLLNMSDVIKYVEISDSPGVSKWNLSGLHIDINKFSGVYHRLQSLDDTLFSIYQDVDKEYAREEWGSYIVYCFSKIDNVVNPINHKVFRQTQLSCPTLYKIAKKININTPRYFFSLDQKKLENEAKKMVNYTARNGLYAYHAIDEKSEIINDTAMVIEYIRGALLFLHVVGEKVFSSIYFKEGGKKFKLPISIQDKILLLGKQLGYSCYEVVMKRTINERYYLFSVSSLPNWNYCSHPINEIWQELIKQLLPKKTRIAKRYSYISAANRPMITGAYVKKNNTVEKEV